MPHLTETEPTAEVYRVPAEAETRLDALPNFDTDALTGPLERDLSERTLAGAEEEIVFSAYMFTAVFSRVAAIAEAVKRVNVLFQSTPFTMEPASRSSSHEPPAHRAFKDLGRWLAADDGDIAEMVGIGRTTPYAWRRDGHEPRIGTVQRLYEYHATLDSVRRRLGGAAFARWLHEGVPSRRDALLAGRLESLDTDVHELLFRRPAEHRIDLAAAPEDSTTHTESARSTPARPSGRRPRHPAR
jgi:hypothetical protein